MLERDGGYLSQACSSAEMLAALYVGILRLGDSEAPPVPPPFPGVPRRDNPTVGLGGRYNGPKAPELDRLIFSPVHYALALYATLVEVGRMAPEGLAQFNADGSSVEMIGAEHSPGIEVTAGSLAQAASTAGGVALARKMRREPGRVWVFMSDGELQEGQTWECVAAMAHHSLDNCHLLVDVNGQQCDGPMDSVMGIEPAAERLRAFGAVVEEVDGHDVGAVLAAADVPHEGRPLVILGRTDPCRGIPALRTRGRFHYIRPGSADERRALEQTLESM